jgi:hypothetical protein
VRARDDGAQRHECRQESPRNDEVPHADSVCLSPASRHQFIPTLASRPAVWDTSKVFKRGFHRIVLSRRWLTFLVMGLAFFVFGAGTFNIAMLFSANASVIARYGWQALMDGAALQLVELVATGYLSMAAYVIFKACEHRLTHDLASRPDE